MSIGQLVTADAVLLDLRPARVPTRMLATLIDLVVVGLVGLGVFRLIEQVGGSAALLTGLTIAASVLFSSGYMAAMETLNRGRTLGALALGLQAVREDGGALRFRQALVRALAFWMIDFAPWTGGVGGLVCAAVNGQGKRIGDVLAGTLVIRTRTPRRPALPERPGTVPNRWPGTERPPRRSEAEQQAEQQRTRSLAVLEAWVATAEMSRVDDQLGNAVRLFVARAAAMTDHPRDQLAYALARQVAARVSPTPPREVLPLDLLTAVALERRRREQLRVTGRPGWVPTAEELPTGWR